MIRIYNANYTENEHLSSNGLKTLSPLKCVETKSDSEWKIDVEIDDTYFDFIEQNKVIVVKTKESLFQPFRIKNITLDKKYFQFTAYHIAYDLQNYFIQDLNLVSQSGLSFITSLLSGSTPANDFTPSSSIATPQSKRFTRISVLEALQQTAELFGAYLIFDNFTITLEPSIGSNRGVVIEYGKNLQGFTVTENWDNVVTSLIPTCGDRVYSVVNADISYDIPYVKTLSFESNYESDSEIKTDVLAQALAYVNKNKYPQVNYAAKSDIVQDVHIGDTILVKATYNLNTTVLAYTYDLISERIISVEFGNYRPTTKNAFKNYASVSDVAKKNSTINQLVIDQTNIINGLYKYGYVVVNDNEIYVVDTLPKEDATYVLRINLGGIGFSSTGINGTYSSAWTLDGKFNANFIQTGTINVGLINGSALDISANTSITSKVSTTDLATTLENYSTITQTSTAISTYVGTNVYTKYEINTTLDSYSTITQTSDAIATRVATTDYNGNTIASLINQTSTTISIEASKININGAVSANTYFKINTDGTMEAKAGKIGSWTLSTDRLYAGSSTTYVGISPGVSSGGDYYSIWAGNSIPSSAPFSVQRDGTLKATSGTIGAWTLSTDRLYAGSSTTYVGISPGVSSGGDYYSIWAGNSTPSSAPFSVQRDGTLKATSGTVGGWTLDDSKIYTGSDSTYMAIDQLYKRLYFSSSYYLEYQSDTYFPGVFTNGTFRGVNIWGGTLITNTNVRPQLANTGYLGTSMFNFYSGYTRIPITVLSDFRLKENIKEIESGVDFILGLKPVSYTLKGEQENHFGFIAQDVKKIMDETIGEAGLYNDPLKNPDWDVNNQEENDKPHYLSLRYEEFIAPMVQTLQSLNERLSALENR